MAVLSAYDDNDPITNLRVGGHACPIATRRYRYRLSSIYPLIYPRGFIRWPVMPVY